MENLIFYKKIRFRASTESFFKFSDFPVYLYEILAHWLGLPWQLCCTDGATVPRHTESFFKLSDFPVYRVRQNKLCTFDRPR